MSLIGVNGSGNYVNLRLMLYALKHKSLVLDSANIANPHRLLPYVPDETFDNIHIVQAESLYPFRDIVRHLGYIARCVNADRIIVTSFDYLFNYDNLFETEIIVDQCFRMMKIIARKYPLIVNVGEHVKLAKKYCDKVGIFKGGFDNGTYCMEPKDSNRRSFGRA